MKNTMGSGCLNLPNGPSLAAVEECQDTIKAVSFIHVPVAHTFCPRLSMLGLEASEMTWLPTATVDGKMAC